MRREGAFIMIVSYDLHIHSCLSPCGDNDMTPNNIVNLASLIGLDVIAVSDHNSAQNLPAVFAAAKSTDLLVIPAMELCSAEEIHLLCLFPTLEQALLCSEAIHKHLPKIKNRAEIFGEQHILNENDERIGTEPFLLINALSLSLDELISFVRPFSGYLIPAHVDKAAYSITASLGSIPPEYGFHCVEVSDLNAPIPFDGMKICDSDAHYLEHMNEPIHFLEIQEKSIPAVLRALGAPC